MNRIYSQNVFNVQSQNHDDTKARKCSVGFFKYGKCCRKIEKNNCSRKRETKRKNNTGSNILEPSTPGSKVRGPRFRQRRSGSARNPFFGPGISTIESNLSYKNLTSLSS